MFSDSLPNPRSQRFSPNVTSPELYSFMVYIWVCDPCWVSFCWRYEVQVEVLFIIILLMKSSCSNPRELCAWLLHLLQAFTWILLSQWPPAPDQPTHSVDHPQQPSHLLYLALFLSVALVVSNIVYNFLSIPSITCLSALEYRLPEGRDIWMWAGEGACLWNDVPEWLINTGCTRDWGHLGQRAQGWLGHGPQAKQACQS